MEEEKVCTVTIDTPLGKIQAAASGNDKKKTLLELESEKAR